jgi:hypothetical protein
MRVADYSVSRQRDDGSWFYSEDPRQAWIDNFHTGFNLCALSSIMRTVGANRFDRQRQLGFDFYRAHFITPEGAPRYFHNRLYPIDSHSIAQTVLTLVEFRDLADRALEQASTVLDWAVRHMWDSRGYFHYQVQPLFRNKIPYMRWSEAWMLLALSSWLGAVSAVGDGGTGAAFQRDHGDRRNSSSS